jgi:8-oxo-dGTP diphosphatase
VGVDDGNGWVACRCGARHWGRFGAAGLLLHRTASSVSTGAAGAAAAGEVLLQLRAPWTHQGGTWGLPGGAADSHEDAVRAALREAHEEAGVVAAEVDVLGVLTTTDHGDWQYTTVLGRLTGTGSTVAVANPESVRLGWTPVEEVAALDLHPGLAHGWSRLRAVLAELVDGTA